MGFPGVSPVLSSFAETMLECIAVRSSTAVFLRRPDLAGVPGQGFHAMGFPIGTGVVMHKLSRQYNTVAHWNTFPCFERKGFASLSVS